MSEPLLTVDGLSVSFRTDEGVVQALDGVSFVVPRGKTIGLVGESGSGKSVTSLAVMGLLPRPPARIDAGSVRFDGRELLGLNERAMREVRGRHIGMIFQEPMTSLNPVFTVGFQLMEALRAHRKLSHADARARAIAQLERVGIPAAKDRIDAYPHQLSGGMRQRVMIAIALAGDPALLIADEPTTALDVTIQAQILELLGELQRDLGMSVLLITHDLGVVAQHVHDVVVMYAGKIVEHAPTTPLLAEPLHPYTRGLLESVPSYPGNRGASRLRTIPGTVPDLSKLPPGCRFADRCSRVQADCRAAQPPLLQFSPQRSAACIHTALADGPLDPGGAP
jgi:peptide/nickel transport system ATP-binding protein